MSQKQKKPKRLVPVYVRWLDTTSDNDWLDDDEIDKEIAKGDGDLLVETWGFIYKRDKYALTIVCTRFRDGTKSSEMLRIPRKAIVNIQRLTLPEFMEGAK